MPIIVLGMHRSGTSMVAKILHTLGVNMGEHFRGPDETQTGGYYEDLEFRYLNSAILNRAHGSWYGVPDRIMITIHAQEYYGQVRDVINSRDGIWGFKDPRTVLTIHAIDHLFEDPKYIVIRRSDMEIIQSLTRRASVRGYFEPTEHWMRLIRIYEQRLNMFYAEKKDLSKFYFLNYGDITSKFLAEEMVNGLAYFCGVEYNRKALDIIRFEQ